MFTCKICLRNIPDEFREHHHLTPKQHKGRETISVCHACGDQIHNLFTNKELQKKYNSLDKLLETDKIKNWVNWLRKHPETFTICIKTKKKK